MIKNLILSLIGTVFLCTLSELIMPEGNMKKYFRLVIGFIVMCVLISPFGSIDQIDTYKFEFDGGMSESELKAGSEAYMMQLHKENIARRIKEIAGENCEAFVQVHSDGSVISITIRGENVSADAINKIKTETGCGNITIVNGYDNEN
ncbi:MAG: stage III sporulation protein AF [Clostridia bacterium]|nr:stage III sporulation protein AF [Clostridia bacterium]